MQINSGAIDAAGPKEIAKAFEMKEAETPKRGIVYAAASGPFAASRITKRKL